MNYLNIYRAFRHSDNKSYKLIIYAENLTVAKEIGDKLLGNCGVADVPDSNMIYGIYEMYFESEGGGERGYLDTSSIDFQEFSYSDIEKFKFVTYKRRVEKINAIL